MKKLYYKTNLVLFLLLVSFFVLNAQRYSIDSLKKVLQTEKQDTGRVTIMSILSWRLASEGNFDQAFQFTKKALTLAEKINFIKGEAYAFWSLATVYTFRGSTDSSLKNYFIALKMYQGVNDEHGIAESYSCIGLTYSIKGNDTKGIDYFTNAVKLYEKSGDKESIARCYLAIAEMYLGNQETESIANFYKALKPFEELGNKKQAAYCLQKIAFEYYYLENYTESLPIYFKAVKIYKETGTQDGLAQCYIYIANIYRIQRRLSEAITYDSTALKISIDEKNKSSEAQAYYCMGEIFCQQIDMSDPVAKNSKQLIFFDEALKNYMESLRNFREGRNSGGMGDCYERIANINLQFHHFSEAQKYADSAISFAIELNFPDNLKNAYRTQAKLDSATGNFRLAFDAYKKYISFREIEVSDAATKKTMQSAMQYDFDKKEAVAKATQDKKDEEAKRLKNQQYFTIAGLGVVVLAVLIIALIQLRNNKQKQKTNALLERQKQKVEITLSELKSTQSQLIQSEKMASLGELTAGIAHEIQNPLNFVNNFSDVNKEMLAELNEEISKGNYDDAKLIAKDLIQNEEKINHHGKRADAIVKGMLQHSRASTGAKEPTNINALAEEYLKLAYHGLRAKDKDFNAIFKTDFDKDLSSAGARINIIPQEIGRVLLNLYNNAFYAVKQSKGPLVTVTTKKIGDKVEIKVTDNGSGIPQNIIDKIFQPFFTTKPTGEGTGLGLSLSYDIIKAHGGIINVTSKEPEGTEFIIDLPV